MGLETSFNFITDLNVSNPAASDGLSQADDHLRGIKNAIKGTFANFTGAAMTATEAELNALDGATASSSEINFLDGALSGFAVPGKALVLDSLKAIDLSGSTIYKPGFKSYEEKIKVHGTVGSGVLVLNYNDGNVQTVTLSANITSLSFSNVPLTGVRATVTLEVTDTRFDVTWPAAIKWAAGAIPPKSNVNTAIDIYTFTTVNGGTTWMGFQVGFKMS